MQMPDTTNLSEYVVLLQLKCLAIEWKYIGMIDRDDELSSKANELVELIDQKIDYEEVPIFYSSNPDFVLENGLDVGITYKELLEKVDEVNERDLGHFDTKEEAWIAYKKAQKFLAKEVLS